LTITPTADRSPFGTGKYGPYVNWGKINATLPKDKDPASVTMEEALELITAKAGASGKKIQDLAAKKPAAKKTAKPKAKKATAAKAKTAAAEKE
jgi:DNA topoisomerase-1